MAWNAPATRSGLDFTERNDTPPPPKLLYIMAFFRTFTTLFLMAYGPEFSGQERVDGRQQKKERVSTAIVRLSVRGSTYYIRYTRHTKAGGKGVADS